MIGLFICKLAAIAAVAWAAIDAFGPRGIGVAAAVYLLMPYHPRAA